MECCGDKMMKFITASLPTGNGCIFYYILFCPVCGKKDKDTERTTFGARVRTV